MSISRRSRTARRSARLSWARASSAVEPIALAVEPADLGFELVDDPVGGLALALEIVQLLGQVVHLALESLAVGLKLFTLAPNLLQALPALFDVLGGLRRE